jgi:hypothetical protein
MISSIHEQGSCHGGLNLVSSSCMHTFLKSDLVFECHNLENNASNEGYLRNMKCSSLWSLHIVWAVLSFS